jgi:hypothetical protein
MELVVVSKCVTGIGMDVARIGGINIFKKFSENKNCKRLL